MFSPQVPRMKVGIEALLRVWTSGLWGEQSLLLKSVRIQIKSLARGRTEGARTRKGRTAKKQRARRTTRTRETIKRGTRTRGRRTGRAAQAREWKAVNVYPRHALTRVWATWRKTTWCETLKLRKRDWKGLLNRQTARPTRPTTLPPWS